MNPVMLKELRQSVRSRLATISLIGFLALLVIIVAIIFGADANAARSSYYHPSGLGPATFGSASCVLTLLMLFVIPFAVFQRLATEHGRGKADLLFATPLPPPAIIDGKLFAGLSMALLFLSAALPFLLLAVQLHGIDLRDVLLYVALLVPAAAASIAVGLLAASLPIPMVVTRVLYGLALFGCIPAAIAVCIGFASGEFFNNIATIAFLLIFAALVSAMFLFRAMAIFAVSPPTTNRARPFRITGAVLWLFWTLAFVLYGLVEQEEGFLTGGFAIGLLLSLLYLVHSVSLRPGVSHRTLLEVRPRFRLARFLVFTTSEGGVLFSLLLAALSVMIIFAAIPGADPSPDWDVVQIVPAYLYFVSFALVVRRIALRVRVLCHPVAMASITAVVPWAWTWTTLIPTLDSTNGCYIPGNLVAALAEEKTLGFHLAVSAVFFAVAFLVYLPVLVRSYRAFRHP